MSNRKEKLLMQIVLICMYKYKIKIVRLPTNVVAPVVLTAPVVSFSAVVRISWDVAIRRIAIDPIASDIFMSLDFIDS